MLSNEELYNDYNDLEDNFSEEKFVFFFKKYKNDLRVFDIINLRLETTLSWIEKMKEVKKWELEELHNFIDYKTQGLISEREYQIIKTYISFPFLLLRNRKLGKLYYQKKINKWKI